MRSLDGAAVSAKAKRFDGVLSRTRRIDKQSAGRAGLTTSVSHYRYHPLLLANDLHSCALGNAQEACMKEMKLVSIVVAPKHGCPIMLDKIVLRTSVPGALVLSGSFW
jgi:hypothetical protein